LEAGTRTGNGDSLNTAGLFSRSKTWLVLAACAVIAALAWFGVYRYQHRFVRTNADLLKLLPHTGVTTFFGDMGALRRAGFLKFLTATAGQEKEYAEFVRDTGFDYVTDLDALAASWDGRQALFVLRGRFEWRAIRNYFATHGGGCREGICTTPTSTPGRAASIVSIQPDVAGVAIGSDDRAAALLQYPRNGAAAPPSNAPLWVEPSHELLKNPTDLPFAVRIFAISLESADSLMLELRPSPDSQTAFTIRFDAGFQNRPMAETARTQLTLNTNMLKLELAREHKQAGPADLAWLLTSGAFQVADRRLVGTWTVRHELLRALQ
jgi:hypothetical protein